MMRVRLLYGNVCSISFLPNSRFMNELAVIWPTSPESVQCSFERIAS
jgi:hypothetical protein